MKSKKFVALIDLPKNLGWPNTPRLGEYKNKFIRSITPCTLENGIYKSWETGEIVEKTPSMQEWGLLVGTMFHLTDGRDVLITRNARREEYLVENIPFNPLTMVRHEAKVYVDVAK